MARKEKVGSAKRQYGSVPVVEIDGVRIVAEMGGKQVGLKRRPLPNGRYYVTYRGKDGKTKHKTFGIDPDWAVYRFVCWREGLKPRHKQRGSRLRRRPPAFMRCPVCHGTGKCPDCKGKGVGPA